nr:hypothetical protein Iba_chr03cCG2060 [Ipomoea batatas]
MKLQTAGIQKDVEHDDHITASRTHSIYPQIGNFWERLVLLTPLKHRSHVDHMATAATPARGGGGGKTSLTPIGWTPLSSFKETGLAAKSTALFVTTVFPVTLDKVVVSFSPSTVSTPVPSSPASPTFSPRAFISSIVPETGFAPPKSSPLLSTPILTLLQPILGAVYICFTGSPGGGSGPLLSILLLPLFHFLELLTFSATAFPTTSSYFNPLFRESLLSSLPLECGITDSGRRTAPVQAMIRAPIHNHRSTPPLLLRRRILVRTAVLCCGGGGGLFAPEAREEKRRDAILVALSQENGFQTQREIEMFGKADFSPK